MKREIKILLNPTVDKNNKSMMKKGKSIKLPNLDRKYDDKFYSTISALNKD